MVFSGNSRGLSVLGSLAVAAVLIAPATSRADNKKTSHAAPKKGGSATVSAFTEAQALRKAILVLAGGNHNYDGHRVKAMHAVKAAVAILDSHVMAHGSKATKEATKQENAAIGQAEKVDKAAPLMRQAQPVSDRRLRQAGEMLAEVRAVLVRQDQKRVLAHVDAAINQLGIALHVR